MPVIDLQGLLRRSDRFLVFQEENNVPKDRGRDGGDSGREREDRLCLQQSNQEGDYHVNAELIMRNSHSNASPFLQIVLC